MGSDQQLYRYKGQPLAARQLQMSVMSSSKWYSEHLEEAPFKCLQIIEDLTNSHC